MKTRIRAATASPSLQEMPHARQGHTYLPGPLGAAGRKMPLSRFHIGVTGQVPSAWTAVLDPLLRQPVARDAKQIATLMSRVLDVQYAGERVHLPAAMASAGVRVLIIDERVRASGGDGIGARRERLPTFQRMVAAASERHRDAEIWIAPSSDAGRGGWLSSLCACLSPARPVNRLTSPGAIEALLPYMSHVYVMGASEGLLALLRGVPLSIFGMPRYAGWKLAHDEPEVVDRTARPTRERFFECLYLELAQYLNPVTLEYDGTLEAVLDHLDLQCTVASRFRDVRHVAGVKFQWWKRAYVTPYLSAGGGLVRWESHPAKLVAHEFAALWGGRHLDQVPPGVPPLRIEDGFIHSGGLGSDMSPPYSQVVDRTGIYFDASRSNDLLTILNTTSFERAELERAYWLRQRIVEHRITKYNLGRRAPVWHRPDDRRVELVVGQVADDASLRLGTAGMGTVEELLTTVRARHPGAFIVYKPHPDVLSGNRRGVLADAHMLADVVDGRSDIVSLIEAADGVHTLSSLAGFDALLRGKVVHTYGLPFYAGWGLTVDDLPQSGRRRPLTLDMLVAGALIRYPLYWDWALDMYTTPEAVVHRLAAAAARPMSSVSFDRLRLPRKAWRWLRNVLTHALWQYRTLHASAASGRGLPRFS